MKKMHNFLRNHTSMIRFERLVLALKSREDITAMFLCGSRAFRTANKERDLSDFDFFLVSSKDVSKMQALHYHIGRERVELMFYNEDKFCKPSSYDEKLLSKLLNSAEPIFTKKTIVKKYFIKYSEHQSIKEVSESELDSMWFKIIWNLLKVKSYEEKEPQLAEILSMQNYFFIGLFYGRLCGEEIYNLSESVKYMKETNSPFWEKYLSILYEPNKRKKIEELIHLLPDSKDFLKKESLIELDKFISPLTVIGDEDKEILKYREEIDKQVIPLLNFLKSG